MGFFDKGSLFRHRNLGHLVRIYEVLDDGQCLIKWEDASDDDKLSWHMIRGAWSTVDLVKEFTPVLSSSKMDRLLGGESFLAEDSE